MGHQRKRLMIDPTVQWAIARRVALHWFGFFLLFLGVNSIIGMLLAVPEKSLTDSAVLSISNQLPQIVIMVLILPIFLRDTIRLSNRFAGPMYRLRIAMAALGQSKPQGEIKFRSGDFWQDVAGKFNVVLKRVSDLEARNRLLEDELARLRAEAGDTAVV